MKQRIILGILLLSPCWFSNALPGLFAQASEEASVAPDGGTTNHIQGIFITQLANAPFSAKEEVEWTRSLADGTVVNSKYYSHVARDTQGRVYRENRKIIPANSTKEPPLNYSFVLNPESRTRTTCYPATQICRVTSYRPATELHPPAVKPGAGKDPSLQREPLGTETIEALEVIGTRETRTVRADAIGNEHEFAVTKEVWYSPHLQINLSVVRNDPRIGKQTLKMTEISMDEPDLQLFEPPAGYRIVDERKEIQ